jgi:hypothetical protein
MSEYLALPEGRDVEARKRAEAAWREWNDCQSGASPVMGTLLMVGVVFLLFGMAAKAVWVPREVWEAPTVEGSWAYCDTHPNEAPACASGAPAFQDDAAGRTAWCRHVVAKSAAGARLVVHQTLVCLPVVRVSA